MSKYCSNCGKRIEQDSKFCSGCGKTLVKEEKEEKKADDMVWNDILIAVIYIVLAFVFAGVGYSILPKEFKNFIKKVLKIGYENVIKNEKEKKRL